MDASGGKFLRERIAERQWRLAEAVSAGRQPFVDPDAGYLEEVGDGYRLYRIPADGRGFCLLKKCLVEGSWKAEPVDELG